MSLIPVPVPLLNANEPEARLVGLHALDGQAVQKGDLLFTIETTKAAAEVDSPASGFLRLVAGQGDTLGVGELMAYISASVDEELPARDLPTYGRIDLGLPASQGSAEELRMTRPARALAETLGIDLATLPRDRLITETSLRDLAGLN